MNKKSLFLFLTFIVLIPVLNNKTFAQDYPANSIAFNIGLNNFHLLDDHATPIIFRGSAVTPSVEYHHSGRIGLHSIEGSYSHFELSAESDNYMTEIFSGHFRYSFFLLSVNKRSLKKVPVLAGGASISSTFIKSDYWILPATSWITGIESWYGCHSIDLAALFRYGFSDKDQIGIKFFLPLVSNVSKPEYSSSGDYNYETNGWDVKVFGKTMFITENFMTNIALSYERNLKRNLVFTAGYEFKYAQCMQPESVKWYMNIFKLGFIYNFNKHQNEKE